MTENEAIEIHIAENIHRIEVIEGFMHSNSDADKDNCKKNISVLTKINGLLDEIQQYRAIGTVEECRSAVKRMRLRKPLKIDAGYRFTDTYRCPECRKDFSGTGIADYCYHCGQALDWSE